MRISHTVMMVTAGVFTPLFTAFALDTLRVMLPWQIAMACIIVADLVAGVRKSLKLGVHVSWSTAFRETMGKIVVYFAWTSAAAVVDVAAHSDTSIVKWACLLVCAIEGGSILSNILKPTMPLTKRGSGLVDSQREILSVNLERKDLVL